MIKYSILILLAGSILILGLTSPNGGIFRDKRGPVPQSQKVAHSSHCAGCHGFDDAGLALVDAAGNDVNIYDDWQFSMMGLSAHDPFWRATVKHETNYYPAAAAEIETTCLKCHAPLGSIQSHLSGLDYSYESMLNDTLGLDGVSCSSCHQQPAKNLGTGHSGNFTIDTNRIMFGHLPNPFQGPMQIYVGFSPAFSEHMYSSGVCAGCHTLITKTLQEDGTPSGDYFVEQATYHEWLNSSYPSQGKECQTCHMPFIHDSVVLATDFQALKKRFPFGLHQFFGANTAMLTMMKDNRDSLQLLQSSPDQAWDESIENNRLSLSRAAVISVSPLQVFDDTLYFEITVKNKTGHKFPSGYPSRLAWLQLVLTDAQSTDTLYSNGMLDATGNIVGRDLPFEPHHQESRSEEDVQIYEMVMSDLNGHLTTRLNAAFKPLKDNRLLPLGFKTNSAIYDTVAVFGEAIEDHDYTLNATSGGDKIAYKIPLNGHSGLAKLNVALKYHALPSRWMNDLFSDDSIEQVARFKAMYTGYEQFTELIDSFQISNIDLNPTAISDVPDQDLIQIYPNPGHGDIIHFEISKPISGNLKIRLIDLQGHELPAKVFNDIIQPKDPLIQGLYFLLFYTKGNCIAVRPYTALD